MNENANEMEVEKQAELNEIELSWITWVGENCGGGGERKDIKRQKEKTEKNS